MAREWFDRVCRVGIKALMLTGVAFTMAACYGPPPERTWQDEPQYQEDQEQVDKAVSCQQSAVSQQKSDN